MPRVKRAWHSKINWLGLAITLLGLVVDPEFQKHIGAIVPAEWFSRIVSVSGMLVMALRTCCTSAAIGKEDGLKLKTFLCVMILTCIASVAVAGTYKNESASTLYVRHKGQVLEFVAGETKRVVGFIHDARLTKTSDLPTVSYAIKTITAADSWCAPVGPATDRYVFKARGSFTATLTIQELPHGEDPLTSSAWRDVYESGALVTMTAADTKVIYDPTGAFYRVGVKAGGYTTGTITVEASAN